MRGARALSSVVATAALAVAGTFLVPASASAAGAVDRTLPPPPPSAVQRTVRDPVDARAAIDLRRVTYRAGARSIGISAQVTSLPDTGVLQLLLRNAHRNDSIYVQLERGPRGGLVGSAELVYNEDANAFAHCPMTTTWDQETGVVGIGVNRPCLARFVHYEAGRTFRFDRLQVSAYTSTRQLTKVDNATPAVLRS